MTAKKTQNLDDVLAKYTDALTSAGERPALESGGGAELGGLLKTVEMLRSALQPCEVPESLRLRLKKAVSQEIAALGTAKRRKGPVDLAMELASAVTTSVRKTAQKAKELVLNVDLSAIIAEAIAAPRPATADVFAYSAETQEAGSATLVADGEGELYEVPTEILRKYRLTAKRQKDMGVSAVRGSLPRNIVLNINLGDPSDTAKPTPAKTKAKER